MPILVLIAIILSFTGEAFSSDYLGKELLTQLYISNDSSIIHVEDSKFYLNPDRACITGEGIFLHSDYMGVVALSNLIHHSAGMYTVGAYDYYMCNNCGSCYSYEPSECSVCGGTSFTRIDNLEEG